MSLTNPNSVVTEQKLSEYHQRILPYLGGMPEMVANKFSKGDLYSTEERMIGQWIDGKPLYQKTISNITLAQGDNNISIDSNVDTIISVIGRATKDTIEFIPIPCASPNAAYTIETWTYDSTSINLATGASRAGAVATITIRYTKTTDSPISIGSDTDYSTTEKIVGTWIDGKPLYQKTLYFSNITISSTQINIGDLSSLNIDFGMVVNYIGNEHGGYFESFGHYACWLRTPAHNIGLQKTLNDSPTTFSDLYITLQYTKTTD